MEAHFFNAKGEGVRQATTDKAYPYLILRADGYAYGCNSRPDDSAVGEYSTLYKLHEVFDGEKGRTADYHEIEIQPAETGVKDV